MPNISFNSNITLFYWWYVWRFTLCISCLYFIIFIVFLSLFRFDFLSSHHIIYFLLLSPLHSLHLCYWNHQRFPYTKSFENISASLQHNMKISIVTQMKRKVLTDHQRWSSEILEMKVSSLPITFKLYFFQYTSCMYPRGQFLSNARMCDILVHESL